MVAGLEPMALFIIFAILSFVSRLLSPDAISDWLSNGSVLGGAASIDLGRCGLPVKKVAVFTKFCVR